MNYLNLYNPFIIREDCFPFQTQKFGYKIMRRSSGEDIPINEMYLKQHIEGKITLGTYNLNKDNKVKWGCLDYDENTEEDFELAKKSYNELKKIGLHPLMENSGGGIYKTHVWVFSEEIDAEIMKNFLEYFCEKHNVKPHEIFPKQEKLINYGNLVKLPLAINKKTNKRSYIFDEKFNELSFEEGIQYLFKIQKSNIPLIHKPKPKIEIINKKTNFSRVNNELGEKFIEFIESNPLPKDTDRNGVVLKNYVYFLKEKGYSDDIILQRGEKILESWPDNKLKTSHINSWIQTYNLANRNFNIGEVIKWIKRFNIEIDLKTSYTAELLEKLRKERNLATEQIVNDFLKDNIVYTLRDDEKQEVWIYKDGIYIPHGISYVEEFCLLHLQESYKKTISKEVVDKIIARTYIESKEFFEVKNKYLICLKNGVLNIKTKELMDYSPEYFFFNKLPLNYKPDVDCPNIKTFFRSILENYDEIHTIQELFGHCLLKEYKIEKMFMFTGVGRNGKGKTIELLKRFLGIENCTAINMDDLTNDPFIISELMHKMVNIGGDINNSKINNTAILKTLRGRDNITARRKFARPITFTNYAKLVFVCNEVPDVTDNSDGFWNSWVYIEFKQKFRSQKEIDSFPEEERKEYKLIDIEIIDKISTDEELSGLLNWALKGFERLMKNKNYSYNKSSEEIQKTWTRNSNSVIAFVDECCEEDKEGCVIKEIFRQHYLSYCKNHNIKPRDDKIIRNTLGKNYGVWDNQITDDFTKQKVRQWNGIRIL